MNYVNQDTGMGQLSFLKRFTSLVPGVGPLLGTALTLQEKPSFMPLSTGFDIDIKRNLLEQLIARFNAAYVGADTQDNYNNMLKWYKLIMSDYPNLLTASQANALPVKLDAKRRRVEAPGVYPPIEHAEPITYPGIDKPPIVAPFIPGLPPTVSIGTWKIPTKTIFYVGGGVAGILIVLALIGSMKKKRR